MLTLVFLSLMESKYVKINLCHACIIFDVHDTLIFIIHKKMFVGMKTETTLED